MDQLLLDTLRDIRADVSGIRTNQEAFMVKSSERLATLETQVSTNSQRLVKIEKHLEHMDHHPVKRWTARRWASVGTVVTACGGILKLLLGLKHPSQ